jgi:hypothetical protein
MQHNAGAHAGAADLGLTWAPGPGRHRLHRSKVPVIEAGQLSNQWGPPLTPPRGRRRGVRACIELCATKCAARKLEPSQSKR